MTAAAARRCSTPNGIKGTYTLPDQAVAVVCGSAQRLTASKEPTPGGARPAAGGSSCSTPNGIKGTYTQKLSAVLHSIRKCSTPNGIKGTYTNACGR